MALGLFISALTESQIVAGVVTLLLCVGLWILGGGAQMVGADGWVKDLLAYACASTHLMSFQKGVLNLSDVLYYVSFVVLGLFLTRTAIERARW
jgi:ABC-2 type transport system permease protein